MPKLRLYWQYTKKPEALNFHKRDLMQKLHPLSLHPATSKISLKVVWSLQSCITATVSQAHGQAWAALLKLLYYIYSRSRDICLCPTENIIFLSWVEETVLLSLNRNGQNLPVDVNCVVCYFNVCLL